jgi:dynein heavy chain 1
MTREITISTRDNVKIVVAWDTLFTTLEDHLASLSSLKQSPYFKNIPEFQEDTNNWESKLTNIRGIFDIWVEVQRKWIYLRGIFKNVDIKSQLPAQYSKFKSIDNEYTALMKRVSTKPVVLDILQLDNLLRQLEREDATMTMIQKALGEYLEKQRQIFPVSSNKITNIANKLFFYFVNFQILIEILLC